jgi:glycosyltransferase involved in cell wall biosynthesis
MSAYNAERHLREAMDSVLAQTFRDFEFLIFDDCSTDTSLEILRSYRDPRLVLIPNEQNQGLTKNLIRAVELARGEYIARMDADDVCLPHRLQTQVDFLDSDRAVSVVGSSVIFFDGAGYEFVAYQPTGHEEIKCELLYGFTMLHPSVMFRKADFHCHGLNYDPRFECSQDHDLWVRAIRQLRFANLQEPLLRMREHANKIGRTRRARQVELSNQIRLRQFVELGVTCSEPEQNAFNHVAGGFLPCNEAELHNYETVLLKLFAANESIRVFDQSTLVRLGSARFRAWCRDALQNGSAWGRYYWNSRLRAHCNATLRQTAGIALRSLGSFLGSKSV